MKRKIKALKKVLKVKKSKEINKKFTTEKENLKIGNFMI